MKRFKAFFKKLRLGRLKLRRQIYTMYFVALIIPLTIVGSCLVYGAVQMLNEYNMEVLKGENNRVKNLMSQLTVQAYNISDGICLNNVQKEILSQEYESASEFTNSVNARSKIDEIVFTYSQIGGIYIYTDNPTICNYKQYNIVTEEIASSSWYQTAMSQSNAFWTSIEGSSAFPHKNNNIALVRRIFLPNSDYKAVVVIRLGDAYIRSSINSMVEDAISINQDGIVYGSKSDWYGRDMFIEIDYNDGYFSNSDVIEVDGRKCFAVVSTTNLHMTNSRMYIATLNDSSYYDIQKIRDILIMILAGAILIPGILLFVFARHFTERVYLLRREMHRASRHEYDMMAKFSGNDEITEAYEDLKTMVANIKEQEAAVYSAQLKEQELRNNQQAMEYKMLASQINPHYLYNTLETIRMKSLTMGNKEVADCIKILSKTIKYVQQNTGTSVITLKKEIDHVENYLTIQKMRFGNRINYTLDIEEGLKTEQYEILPLLLQPIVENAVIHGLEHIHDEGHVGIEVYRAKGDLLEIVVKDNGKGMRPEEFAEIGQKLNTPGLKLESSIGVYNICERIRLYYGEEYGIRMESVYGGGTKVTIVLPAVNVG